MSEYESVIKFYNQLISEKDYQIIIDSKSDAKDQKPYGIYIFTLNLENIFKKMTANVKEGTEHKVHFDYLNRYIKQQIKKGQFMDELIPKMYSLQNDAKHKISQNFVPLFIDELINSDKSVLTTLFQQEKPTFHKEKTLQELMGTKTATRKTRSKVNTEKPKTKASSGKGGKKQEKVAEASQSEEPANNEKDEHITGDENTDTAEEDQEEEK